MQGSQHRAFKLTIHSKCKFERRMTYEYMAWIGRVVVFSG
jgi:hypothetical protein